MSSPSRVNHSHSGFISNRGRWVNTTIGAVFGKRARSLFNQANRSGPISGSARDTLSSAMKARRDDRTSSTYLSGARGYNCPAVQLGIVLAGNLHHLSNFHALGNLQELLHALRMH